MNILKSILHRWNSTTKEYDTLHPETESACVTDWHSGIMNSLASKVLPTVVSELTTDSVMGKLMKFLLTASGVKYNIAQNGYVCLGSFFGGLIIQWGKPDKGESRYTIIFPISFSTVYQLLASTDAPPADPFDLIGTCEIHCTSLSKGNVYTSHNGKELMRGISWIAIGR